MQGGEESRNPAQVLAELLESSDALTRSLQVHSPHFLEYLEKRGQAIEALTQCSLSGDHRAPLIQALEGGRSAQAILRREREKIEGEIAALAQRRSLFRELGARSHPSGLDIKA